MLQTRWIVIVLAVVMSGLPACTRSPDCFREDIYCAALVTDVGGLNDHGNSGNAWAGLGQSRAEGVVDRVAYIESIDTRDYEKNIAFFADAGYDVVITSGSGMRDATVYSADLYPGPVFIGIGQTFEANLPNLIPVTFPEDQMGFLAGTLAANVTGTKIVGAVCETSGIDPIWRFCEGFRAGVTHVDRSVEAIIVYRDRGSRDKLFNDEEWGRDTARDLIQRGADVIFAAGGRTGEGALREANRAGIRTIGVERDLKTALGDDGSTVMTSVVGMTQSVVRELLAALKDGHYFGSGVHGIGYLPLDENIQRSAVRELDEILAGLSNGSINTNVPTQKP